MMADRNKNKNRAFRRFAGSLLGQNKEWLEITGLAMGDVHSEKTVYVTKGASLAGDIIAARVIVAGFVYGFVAGREVIVEDSGQIWGDICAVALTLAPRAKVYGWFTSLDEGTIDLLRAGEFSLGDIPNLAEESFPADLINAMSNAIPDPAENQKKSAGRLAILHALRAEAATAVLARAEIEAMFEDRLEEAIDARYDQAVTDIQNQLDEATSEIARLQKLLRRAANQLQHLRDRYLLVKADLDAAQARLWKYQDTNDQIDRPVLPINSHIVDSNIEIESDIYSEELTRLRVTLVEKEIELNQTKEQLEKLTNRLRKFQYLAEKRVRKLSEELDRAKSQLAKLGSEH